MLKFLAFSMIALFVAGCSSVPVDPATATRVPPDRIASKRYAAPIAGTREIVIKRDDAFRAGGSDARFYIDGQRVANIGNGEVLKLHLKDGRYKFGVKTYGFDDSNEPIKEINVLVGDGEDAVFRIYAGGAGFTIQPTSY